MIKWLKRNLSKINDDADKKENTSSSKEPSSKTPTSSEIKSESKDQIELSHFDEKTIASDKTTEELNNLANLKPTLETQETSVNKERLNFFSRLKQSLEKTRKQLGKGIGRLLLGKKEIDASFLEELETLLLRADVGISTTQSILKHLTETLEREHLANGDVIYERLKKQLQTILEKSEKPLSLSAHNCPHVILMVGVNGAGKTTSIGKLAKHFQQQGKKVMLAAGDTFRAAAIEQLRVWGERNQIPVIAQHTGADSASVIFDALQAAKARSFDLLIADTAGRLHTQSHLMDELKKVKRVLQKLDPAAPHEILLVLDASIGQNALYQARQFHEAIGLSGLLMTKLDGTAKGGILFAIANELDIPIRYLGTGEQINDLRPFEAEEFVKALLE